jgi:hypothetical protein
MTWVQEQPFFRWSPIAESRNTVVILSRSPCDHGRDLRRPFRFKGELWTHLNVSSYVVKPACWLIARRSETLQSGGKKT